MRVPVIALVMLLMPALAAAQTVGNAVGVANGQLVSGFSDLSGGASCAQMPALTGDTTTSAGSCATTTTSSGGNAFTGATFGASLNLSTNTSIVSTNVPTPKGAIATLVALTAPEGQHGIATDCNAGCSFGTSCTTGGTQHCEMEWNGSAWKETGL